jgi:hypothetical protein
MVLLEHVKEWMCGDRKLQSILSLLRSRLLPAVGGECLRTALLFFAIVALSPSAVSKFNSLSLSTRAKTHKRRRLRKFVTAVKAVNCHRQATLHALYNTSVKTPHFRGILQALEHARSVTVSAFHDSTAVHTKKRFRRAILTCCDMHDKQQSWIITSEELSVFKAFFHVRHFNSEIELSVFWWWRLQGRPRTRVKFERLLELAVQYAKSDVAQRLLQTYEDSFQAVQRRILMRV